MRFFDRAEALLPAESPQRTPISIRCGETLRRMGSYAAAQQRLEMALEQAGQQGDQTVYCDALRHLGRVASWLGDQQAGAGPIGRGPGPGAHPAGRRPHRRHIARSGLGALCAGRFPPGPGLFSGDPEPAPAAWLAAASLSADLNALSLAASGLDEYEESRDLRLQSLAIAEELGNRHGAAIALNNLGEIARLQGNASEARNYYQQALAIFIEGEDQPDMAMTLGNLGHTASAQEITRQPGTIIARRSR